MTDLRRLRPDEFNKSISLLQYAFNFDVSDDRYVRLCANFSEERVWGVFEGGNLQSQLCTLDFDLFVNGTSVRAAGVTRVSSYPEVRRSGNISRLVRHALEELRADARTVALLIPFNVGFYRRLGWEIISDYSRVRLRPAQLPRLDEEQGEIAREELSPEIATDIYRDFAFAHNAAIVRAPHWWREVTRPRKAGHAALWRDAGGEAAGYVIYALQDHPSDLTYQDLRGRRELVVHELVHRSDTARRQLWRFLKSHETMVDTISVTLPVDDPLPFELTDADAEVRHVPYAMGRIVDLKPFIEQYSFVSTGKATDFVVEVIDQRAEWNNGHWHLHVGPEGKATVENVASGSAPVATIDIGALTALLLGYLRPQILYRTGRLKADAATVAALEFYVPHARPFTPDFF